MESGSIPTSWAGTAEFIASDSRVLPPPVVVVCGPANSGKSAFSRVLLSSLVKRYGRVGYLDTDVGQPEFSTPGTVSLHLVDNLMPDLTVLHLRDPERCFFFGKVSAKTNRTGYFFFVCSLYDYFVNKYYHELATSDNPSLPLIINTSGWVKGAGYDMLVDMLRYFSSTHVVKICSSTERKNLPGGHFWMDDNEESQTVLCEICEAKNDGFTNRSSAKTDASIIRDLRFIAYFRKCLPRDFSVETCRQLAHSLASIAPVQLPFSSIKVLNLDNQVLTSSAYHALKARIVGLADSSFVPTSTTCSRPYCIGIGIVKHVDTSKEMIYLVMPVSSSSVQKIDLIFESRITTPSLLLDAAGLPN